MRLQDKVAIVTGGTRGLGRCTAETFARQGAKVLVADLSEQAGLETVERIEKAGGQAAFTRTDVTNSADVQNMMRKACEAFGKDALAKNG